MELGSLATQLLKTCLLQELHINIKADMISSTYNKRIYEKSYVIKNHFYILNPPRIPDIQPSPVWPGVHCRRSSVGSAYIHALHDNFH